MNLGEKLDELRNNVLRDTSHLIAGDDDSLWSDETLLRYIKQGERKFARQTLCIRDATSARTCQLKLKAGQRMYPLDPAIIGVLSARYDTDMFDLARSGHAILTNITPPDFLTFDPSAMYTVPPGRPSAYYTDETLVYAMGTRVTFSIFPDPGTDQDGKIVNLRVVRTPFTEYTLENIEAESEIPEDYELVPLQWAAHLATKNHDGDAGSSVQADKFKASYDDEIVNAMREIKRKLFANMVFRFGANAFSWVR